ncbi:MAG: TonB-dependent receptor [Paludibacter sp.]|nr:TonB-dependent receptor [Paludibacter sp.]
MKSKKTFRVKTLMLHQSTRWFRRLLPILIICMVFPLNLLAQTTTIAGLVVDSKNEPLIGVSVIVKGAKTGTVTNFDGKFTIEASSKDVLVFSYVGMNPKEVSVGTSKTLRVVMEDNSKALEEIVVVGYGSVKRKDLTTAVSSVSTKDIAERPIISAASAIQGKAAGVTVMSANGEPGAAPVVRIRGNTSINGGNDPLYVVDGVPMGDINFLSANDIESMQILKDASSAAIYGSAGANGVVIITTKLGSKGQAKVSFNAHLGATQVVKQMQSLNTAQYTDLMNEIGAVTLPGGLTDQTDWFKETFRTGLTQDYQLSISNATDKMRYFVSGGYSNESGVIPVAYFKRYNFRVNLENQIKSWLKLSTNLTYSDFSNNGIISGTGSNRAGVILSVINTPTYAPIWNPAIPSQYYDNFYGAQTTSPVENMSRTANNKSNNNRFIGSIAGEISFTKDLKYKSSLSMERNYYNGTTFLDPITTSYGRSTHGNASDTRSLFSNFTFDNVLTLDKKIEKHGFSLMAGSSYTYTNWNQSYQSVSNYADASVKTLNYGNKVDIWGTGTQANESKMLSYIGRATYNYDGKYLLTTNLRYDGSSKLNPNHRWDFFPSLSAAWRISSENFMKNLDWLDDMKIRVGWGRVGSQGGISNYSYLYFPSISRVDWTGPANPNANANISVSPPRLMKNEDLTWEKATTTNVGIDLAILKNKINFTIDAYYKKTTDLLIYFDMPATVGMSVTRNQASMSNRGIEFTLNTKNIVGKFNWETDFNMSFNKNTVDDLSFTGTQYAGQTSMGESTSILKVGEPLGVFYGYISKGVNPETGDLMYLGKDGTLSSTPKLSDRTIIGDPNPAFTYGMTNNLSYNGLSLSVFLQGSQGNQIYNVSRMETEGMYDAKNQSVAVLDRWERPGMITYMPRATQQKTNMLSSTRFIEDGSYLRLKSLTLSYDLAGKTLKSKGITKLQPYFTAQNLLTLTKYKGFDPEVNQYGGDARVQGVDYGTYPQSKSYVVGINVEF